ncbi:LapB repeat-containing protein [Listeria sp. FSL L7-1509]|uniref:LapB repeat-containing protein n=1 Tax=Listeria immobilis TaxID=2713502 RepID=A0ABR6SS25_9LIST|nr:LapB repeat-containing protein [Listeria immobilis]MBC1483274.1 LapB repeat-containing protein [Listeria immobilis]MBC1505727.1 LapB repeat-containing protein [Listeria immobilis]MBC1508482.1 LapB repeat-containing protein [Listeria immobilis]MBC6302001.1 LapB repeat-containing protein [Listeria immobilis]MBC6311086.1 LapB repeat-containing protein [Listeria immobilis]
MKKLYLSVVIISLVFSAIIPIPATVYAETTTEEVPPNSIEEKMAPETKIGEKEATNPDTLKEENTDSIVTPTEETTSAQKEKSYNPNTTNVKEKAPTAQVFAAGDTYLQTFPDENLAKVIALQITGSDDTSQVVTQNQLDSVTTLNASAKNIADATGIGELTNLTSINLSQNQLTSIAPITNLSALTTLDVSDNLLNTISITSGQNIANLSTLNLSNNPSITSLTIEDLPNLTNINTTIDVGQTSLLEELTLSNLPLLTTAGKNSSNTVNFSNYSTALTTIKLASLPKITTIDFDSNLIADADIQNMAVLNYIDLHGNKLTDASKLINLPVLTTLDLSSNQLTTTGVSGLFQLNSLQVLNLDTNSLNSFELDANNDLPNLSNLSLRYNPTITKLHIEDQPKLVIIYTTLNSNQTSLLEELTLSNLPALTSAGAGTSNTINFSGYSDVLRTVKLNALPEIQTADLDSNWINDIDVQNMAALSYLDLKSNELSDITKLANLPVLNHLDATSNQLTNTGIANITQLDALQTLELDSNKLTSFVLDADNDLPNLTALYLRYMPTITKITMADQPNLVTVLLTLNSSDNSLLEELTLSNLPNLTTAGNNTSSGINFAGYSDQLSAVNLTSLPKVSLVNLSENSLTNVNIQDMGILNSINLDSNNIADISNLVNLPTLSNLQVNNNLLGVLPTNIETEAPSLTTLFATNQTISLPNKIVTGNLSIANEISNNGVISTPTTISNNGEYQDGNVNWEYDNIKNLSNVSYNFSEPVKYSSASGTFSGTVTQPITVSLAPVITADDSISYPKFSEITEAEFLTDIQATTSDGSSISSNFETVVDFSTAGNYTVTLNAVNSDGVAADPVTVTVTVEKAPAPIITANSEITYMKHSTISSAEFLTDIQATTNDGSPITSDFTTVVDFETAGDYTVTLNALNVDGVAANPVSVTVHIAKDPAPIITADSEISYPKNSSINSQQFYTDIHASTSDGSAITSDFDTATDFTTAGDYNVTLNSVNSDGVAANPVTVVVHIDKDPAPIITADSEISYPKNSSINSQQFYTDIHASTNDGSPITSDFDNVVDFSSAGDYTVTLNSVNSDGVAANPVTVTVTVEKAPAPIITANSEITYMKHSTISSAEFLTDIQATTNDGSPITSDFTTVVDFETAGDYTVTLNALNVDGVAANPVSVTVHIAKDPAPIITADSEISYPKNSSINSQQFYTDIHASTNDGSPITSNFDNVVDFSSAGDYTVTLNSVNTDGVSATPVLVTIHVEKAPAPVITADSEISYTTNSTITPEKFYTDIHATTSDGSSITSDFSTVVDFQVAGDYTVTLQSVNVDGVPADPVSVTVHIVKAAAPIITADSNISYAKNSTIDSQEFYSDIHATTDDGSPITSDFDTVVNFQVAGDYTVTLQSVNEDGVAANPVSVIVHIDKSPAPVISADSKVSYAEKSTVSSQQFYKDIHATTNDGSVITSNFDTVVNFQVAGDYKVTLRAVNEDGVAANPAFVIVHIEKAPAPVISADSDISYKKNSKITIQQFYDSIHATTSDGSPITSDFESVVNFAVTGDYTVTLQSINSDGVVARPVQVIVHITADEPTPPDNTGNDGSNTNQPKHHAEKGQPNITLPHTGDTNNSLMGIVFLFIASSILFVMSKNKKGSRK